MECTPATKLGSCSNFCTTVASICAGVWPCAGRWTPCRLLFILSSFLDLRIWIVVSSRRRRESSAEMPALNWLLRCVGITGERRARGFGGRLSSRDERAHAAAASVARLCEGRSPGPARQRYAAASFGAPRSPRRTFVRARVLLDSGCLTSLGLAKPLMIAVFLRSAEPLRPGL